MRACIDCTTPTNGLTGPGNINVNPQFRSMAGGDYRLLPSSPCVNKGIIQMWMWGAHDLGGRIRIAGKTVDMGAYEYQPPPGGQPLA